MKLLFIIPTTSLLLGVFIQFTSAYCNTGTLNCCRSAEEVDLVAAIALFSLLGIPNEYAPGVVAANCKFYFLIVDGPYDVLLQVV